LISLDCVHGFRVRRLRLRPETTILLPFFILLARGTRPVCNGSALGASLFVEAQGAPGG
jgi:hypothetical protein